VVEVGIGEKVSWKDFLVGIFGVAYSITQLALACNGGGRKGIW
jgi:hypothetical protein